MKLPTIDGWALFLLSVVVVGCGDSSDSDSADTDVIQDSGPDAGDTDDGSADDSGVDSTADTGTPDNRPIFLFDDDQSHDGVQALMLLIRDDDADLRYISVNGAADQPAIPAADVLWDLAHIDSDGRESPPMVGHGCDQPITAGLAPGGADFSSQFSEPLADTACVGEQPTVTPRDGAVTALAVWNQAAAEGEPVHIVISGGMTNFARYLLDEDCSGAAAQNDGNVLRVASLHIMGGRDLSEFNFASDPEALKIVLEALEFGHPRVEFSTTPRLVTFEMGATQPITTTLRDSLESEAANCMAEVAHAFLGEDGFRTSSEDEVLCFPAVDDSQLRWVHPFVSQNCLIPYFLWDALAVAWARNPEIISATEEVGVAVLQNPEGEWVICYSNEACWSDESDLAGRDGAHVITTAPGAATDAVNTAAFRQYFLDTLTRADN